MPRVKTPNQGATDTRARIIRKIRSMMLRAGTGWVDASALLDWIKSMDERASKKKGGLGRK